MKIAITGHTNIELYYDKKYTGDIYDTYAYNSCYKDILNKLNKLCVDEKLLLEDLTLISGMARGVDEVFAHIAMDNNLPLIISIPKSLDWHKDKVLKKEPHIKIQAIEYEKIINYVNLKEIREVKETETGNNYGYFLSRNQDMVNICDMLISWKRNETTGTMDCINRGIKQDKYKGNA